MSNILYNKDKLLNELAIHSYKYNSNKPFKLVSGEYSDEYLDCRLTLSQPLALDLTGELVLFSLIDSVTAIGGLTMGADPISISASLLSSHGEQRNIKWFSVRKNPKIHGTNKVIEGDVYFGDNVAIVDDVVTSGKSTIQAIEECRKFGLNVVQVIILVNREQNNGFDNIKKFINDDNVQVSYLFTKQEIKDRWMELNEGSKI